MFVFHSLQIKPRKILAKLKEFENFCLGKKKLSPEQFQSLNSELSMGAVFHIGKRRFSKQLDGKHLLWTGLDDREHDLGPVNRLDIKHTGPGFNRGSTMSLGNDMVEDSDVLEIPALKKQVSVVRLKDGNVGIGPNYKIALRNAALKMHLNQAHKAPDAWTEHHGNA